jgi:hypothetical protein
MYHNHMQLEGDTSLSLESSSFDSVINSPVETPVVNDNTVVEILRMDTGDLTEEPVTLRKHRFRKLFRSLSWKKPEHEADSERTARVTSNKKDEDETKQKYESEFSLCSIESNSTGPIPKENNGGSFDNLYDLTPPMENLPADIHTNDLLEHEMEPKTLVIPLGEVNTPVPTRIKDKSINSKESPIKTLSRRFSVFSLGTKKPVSRVQYPNFENAKDTFTNFSLLLRDYFDDIIPPTLVLGRLPSQYQLGDHKIYLTSDNEEDGNLSEYERANLERFLYYPYTRSFAETLKLNDWKDKTELNKTLSRPKNSDEFTQSTNVESPNVDGMLTTRSMNLAALQEYIDLEGDVEVNYPEFSNGADSHKWMNRVEYILEIDELIKTGMFDVVARVTNTWKIWMVACNASTDNRKKYKVVKVIPADTEMACVKNKYKNFLDKQLKESEEKMYVLKRGELPTFHGKKKVKFFGEYVFLIPSNQSTIIWCHVLQLLCSNQCSMNTVGLEVIGVCWKKYRHRDKTGFQLCFYVDDRLEFSEKRTVLFLSDLRNMIPEGHKQFFKRCKTLFPGHRKLRVIELP